MPINIAELCRTLERIEHGALDGKLNPGSRSFLVELICRAAARVNSKGDKPGANSNALSRWKVEETLYRREVTAVQALLLQPNPAHSPASSGTTASASAAGTVVYRGRALKPIFVEHMRQEYRRAGCLPFAETSLLIGGVLAAENVEFDLRKWIQIARASGRGSQPEAPSPQQAFRTGRIRTKAGRAAVPSPFVDELPPLPFETLLETTTPGTAGNPSDIAPGSSPQTTKPSSGGNHSDS